MPPSVYSSYTSRHLLFFFNRQESLIVSYTCLQLAQLNSKEINYDAWYDFNDILVTNGNE